MPPHPLLLLVEGNDDKFVIAELIEKATGLPWEPADKEYMVDIVSCGSDTQILQQLSVKWKESGRRILGLVIDSDHSALDRWGQVKARAPSEVRSILPAELPAGGLVVDAGEGRRFGAWLMPDNRTTGMMETFLKHLRPADNPSLHEHARHSMRRASELGAQWREAHVDKAEIHTWLAWQDPPGQQLHSAVMKGWLDAHSELAGPFVAWFRTLYDV